MTPNNQTRKTATPLRVLAPLMTACLLLLVAGTTSALPMLGDVAGNASGAVDMTSDVTGPASAQLGAVTGSLPAGADLSQVTAMAGPATALVPVPTVNETLATPAGSVEIYADADRFHLCYALFAALPIDIVAAAAAESAGCLDVDLSGAQLTMNQQAAGTPVQLDASAELPNGEGDGKVGFFAKIGAFFSALFDGEIGSSAKADASVDANVDATQAALDAQVQIDAQLDADLPIDANETVGTAVDTANGIAGTATGALPPIPGL